MKRYSPVKILPETVANQIAAGEVVDRPASVVKELAENSIDAGAAHLVIKVEAAGKNKIVVEDDGSGMPESDLVESLKRHATSKITTAADLDHIGTLGFRGEALPSIASVSRMELVTRQRERDEGLKITVEGGAGSSVTETPAAPGTRVEVAELFYNVPARRKFLKSDATELKNIADTVGRLALVHPEVGFELTSEKRRLLSLPPGQGLCERAADVVGQGSVLYWYEREERGRLVRFAFAAPHLSKGRREGVKLFVNRRAVNDRILYSALMEGYRGLIERGRYPVALLWLELPTTEVDVNVHPAKREVRFADEGSVFKWVMSNVSRALSEAPWAAPEEDAGAGQPVGRAPDPWAAPAAPLPGASAAGGGGSARVSEALAGYGKKAGAHAERATSLGPPAGGARSTGYSKTSLPLAGYAPPRRSDPAAQARAAGGLPAGSVAAGSGQVVDTVFGPLAYMGSFAATYLLFTDESSKELVMVDQHAAHERILYEKFLAAGAQRSAAQQLLVPVVIDLTVEQMAVWDERREALAAIGISAEPFGKRAVSVTQTPPGLGAAQVKSVVEEVLGVELLDEAGETGARARKLAARAACSAAVKAGSALVESEVLELLERLKPLENPTHCPHGRPLAVRLSREKVESLFHRR